MLRKGEVYHNFKEDEEMEDEVLKKLGGRYHEYSKKQMRANDDEEVEDNLEYIYEMKQKQVAEQTERHQQKVREKEMRKNRFLPQEGEEATRAEEQLKMETTGDAATFLRKRALDETSNRVGLQDLKKSSKWFDRDIFQVLGDSNKKLIVQDEDGNFENEEGDGEYEEGDEEEGDIEYAEGEEEEYEDGEDDQNDGMDEEYDQGHEEEAKDEDEEEEVDQKADQDGRI